MLLHSFRGCWNHRRPRTRGESARPRAAGNRYTPKRLSVESLEGRALPSLIAAQSFDAGSSPASVAVGDFNGDGFPDLATANYYSNNVSVLLGNGDGTFQAASDFPAAWYPYSVAAGDFNGDGFPDLAVANSGSDTVSVLLGNGDGTFRAASDFATGDTPRCVAVEDFNGDGLSDLAVANQSGTVSALLGNGDGTFQVPRDFPAGSGSFSLAVGDFNGDGIADLAVPNYFTDNLSVLLGNGDGTFQVPRTFAADVSPESVAVGEFNGDGIADLAVANSGSDTVSVLQGNGDGTFQAPRNFATGSLPTSVSVADFNADGRPDLAVVNQYSDTVSVLLGGGDGTFQDARDFAVGGLPATAAVGDFDGNGRPDIAVPNFASGTVSVLFGNGDGTFSPTARNFTAADRPWAVATGDLNGDGIPDLAVACSTTQGVVSVLLGSRDGTFQAARNFAVGSHPSSVALGDFNGDGFPDLVVANQYSNNVSVLLGNGDGTFQAASNFSGVYNPVSVAVGDFNGDGIADLAVANSGSGTISLFLGNGDGTFPTGGSHNLEYMPTSVAVADLNGDGRPDLVVTDDDGVRVAFGDGDGQFRTFHDIAIGALESVAVADLNGDGIPDLATAGGNDAVVLLGNGDGTFQDPDGTPAGFQCLSVAVGDFNGDTLPDLAVAFRGGVRLLPGNGDGTFQTTNVSYVAGSGPRSLAVGDLDGDGWPDLAVANAGSNTVSQDVSILLNEGIPTSVTINQAVGQEDPTAGPAISFDVAFSEPVTEFDASDIDLSASTVGGTLVPTVTGSGSTYTVTVTGMTGAGTVVASIPAGAAIDVSGKPTLASTSTDDSVTFSTPPTVAIDQAANQPDPTNSAPITYDVHFSQAVTGFAGSDVRFTGSTVGGALVATVSGTGQDYTVTVTVMTGTGTVKVAVQAGAAVNDLGMASAASTSTDNSVTFDNESPTVTIDQAAGQADPTNVPSVRFDVTFSEPVTGFDPADVSLAGSTAGGTLTVTVTGSLDTYTVTVTGMTTRGLVVATVPAGGAADAAGNPTLASTSTDNAVEFLNTGTLGFSQAVYAATEDGDAVTITVTRAGQTDGAVSIDYATHDNSAHSGGSAPQGQADYTPTSGTLTWADGEGGDKAFTVPILPDTLNEGKELIQLALTDAVGSPGLGATTAAIAIAPSDGQGPGGYFDQDGDKYTIKLNGKTGSLLYYRTDPDGDGRGPIELIELTGTLPDPLKPKAGLVITVAKTKTSTDGGTVGLGAVTGSGLKYISARKANLNLEGITLNGYLGALVIGNVTNGADVTTLATTNSKQKTRISALAIGDGSTIDVGANVSSLVAKSFGASSFRTQSVGVFRVNGDVTGADIEVAGNVGAIVVGTFRDSQLFAGYTGASDGTGTFNSPATVNTFRCVSKSDGFANSRVIATAFKSVTITNLDPDNSGGKFGFYADESLGAIRVIGPTKFRYNGDLPTPQGVGDFELTIV